MESHQFKIIPKNTQNESSKRASEDHVDTWFVFRERQHFGPFSVQKIHRFLENGQITLGHFAWQPGQQKWICIKDLKEFAKCKEGQPLGISDEQFSDLLQLEKEDLVRFYDKMQAAALSEKSKGHKRLGADLYESIRKKLPFAMPDHSVSKSKTKDVITGGKK